MPDHRCHSGYGRHCDHPACHQNYGHFRRAYHCHHRYRHAPAPATSYAVLPTRQMLLRSRLYHAQKQPGRLRGSAYAHVHARARPRAFACVAHVNNTPVRLEWPNPAAAAETLRVVCGGGHLLLSLHLLLVLMRLELVLKLLKLLTLLLVLLLVLLVPLLLLQLVQKLLRPLHR